MTATGCTGTVVWSNGQTGNVLELTPTAAGKYTYWAICKSNVGECQSEKSNEVVLTVGQPVGIPTVVSQLSNVCPYETVSLASAVLSSPSEGGEYEFHTSNSVNSALVTNPNMVGAGTYYVFERSTGGCISSPAAIKVTITDCGEGGITPDSTKYVDIAVHKTADTSHVKVGGLVTYTLKARNLSQNMATGVVIRDVLPGGLFLTGNPSGVGYSNGTITASIDTLKAGQEVSFSYTARVTAAGMIINRAELLSLDQIDNVLSNNTSEYRINDIGAGDLLGVSKVAGQYVDLGNRQFEVPYTIYVTNMGSSKLTGIQVTDDLDKTFGNGAVIVSDTIPVTAEGTLVANPSYTGRGNHQNLLTDSLSSLEAGARLAINFKVKVDLTAASTNTYYNMAMGYAGKGSSQISDQSTNGINPDPDGDGDPGNNQELTSVVLQGSSANGMIGVALSAPDIISNRNGYHEVTFEVKVKNVGNTPISNLQVYDSSSHQLGSDVIYTLAGPPVLAQDLIFRVNPEFDGKENVELLMPDSLAVLDTAMEFSIFFTIKVHSQTTEKVEYENVVYITGTSVSGNSLTDISNPGSTVIPEIDEPVKFAFEANNPDKLVIPQGISPNGDGRNDELIIRIPDGMKVREFTIYNRWGHPVWAADQEQLETDNKIVWTGRTDYSLVKERNQVPDGTYYYSMKIEGEKDVRVGFLVVSK